MIDQHLNELFGDHNIEQAKSDTVYHYTSISGLKSIIENKQFWITRSDFLNDPDELLYFANLVTNTIDAIRVTEAIPESFLNSLNSNYVSFFQNAYPQQYYILSLSMSRDSLSMWNYYGKDDGYCIGLDLEKLTETIRFNRLNFIHGSVIYSADQQIAILDSELRIAYEYWINNHNGNQRMIHTITDTLFARWIMYALFFKHNGYHQENEYRLVLTHRNDLDVKYRTAHGVFTPYIVLPATRIDQNGNQFDESETFPLESVTISPFIKHDRALRGAIEWLRKNNHPLDKPNQAVYPSSIVIRF